MPSASRSSLSHSTKVRSSIAPLPIGYHLVEPAAGDDEPADMLREMARERLNLDGERAHFLHTRAVHVDADSARVRWLRTPPPPMPQIEEESAPIVSSDSPKTLPNLADGRTAAVGDDGPRLCRYGRDRKCA
jgi:hypothetical protein